MFCPRCRKNDCDWILGEDHVMHRHCMYAAANEEMLDNVRRYSD